MDSRPYRRDPNTGTGGTKNAFSLFAVDPVEPAFRATYADFSSFSTGPAIKDYGPVTDVDVTFPVWKDTILRHSFEVAGQAEDAELNRTLVSAARFINMHARAGVEADSVNVAVVVHGTAVHNVTKAT